jgi:hypothetical protein
LLILNSAMKVLYRCFFLVIAFILFVSTASNAQLTITFSSTANMPYLVPPDVSAVLSDPTDPAAINGIGVDVKDAGISIPSGSYTLTAVSSKTSVISNANIVITKADGQAIVKLLPTGVGYANITLTLAKASSTKTLVIKYAVSAAATTPAFTRFHTGLSNASAAIALDDNYMVIADDEFNKLYVQHRSNSGLPVVSYFYGDGLALTDGSAGNYKEVDVEAGVRSKVFPNRIYWLGSMSNSSSNNNKPNRNRIFATNITGTGAATAFTLGGFYGSLRDKLIAWGNTYSYNLTASAAEGKDPKAIDGFNIEGLCFAPDNTTLFACFRAPLVPVSNRTKALIAPILNFEAWFNNGAPSGNPAFGAPIEISLGGRSIRDIIPVTAGGYLIVAGSYEGTNIPAIYKWTGNAVDQPILQTGFNVAGLNLEAVIEVNDNGIAASNKYQFISDDGSTQYYGDGLESKDLTVTNYQKFRSDVITSASPLPLALEYFTAVMHSNAPVLSWKMVVTNDIASFEVYRSFTGVDFQKIASVSAGVTHFYGYNDVFTPGAKEIYYQLKIIQKNGGVFYSPVRFVTMSAAEIVKVYPNPVAAQSFTIATNQPGNKLVKLFDMTGRIITTAEFIDTAVDIFIGALPAGSYQVVVSGAEGVIYRTRLLLIGR